MDNVKAKALETLETKDRVYYFRSLYEELIIEKRKCSKKFEGLLKKKTDLEEKIGEMVGDKDDLYVLQKKIESEEVVEQEDSEDIKEFNSIGLIKFLKDFDKLNHSIKINKATLENLQNQINITKDVLFNEETKQREESKKNDDKEEKVDSEN